MPRFKVDSRRTLDDDASAQFPSASPPRGSLADWRWRSARIAIVPKGVSLASYLSSELDALRALDRFRDPADAQARESVRHAAEAAGLPFLDATSNDYLGLASFGIDGRSVSRETARTGAGAARLVQGTWPEHERLERELSDWVRLPSALLFASGYAANLGVLAALADRESVVLSDQLNHASIIDGCRLSRAQTEVVPHLDLAALEAALLRTSAAARRWVVTESYFSMDGDGPDLGRLRGLCDRHHAFLVVDEAHALGVYGPGGAGRCAEVGITPDVLIGTLGKSVGTQGAFVAGREELRTFLWNRARSFVFSTGTSPELCLRTLFHVQAVRRANAARQQVLALAHALREGLRERGIATANGSFGPVVAVLAGSSANAMKVAQTLRGLGVLAQPIRPPTVPEGQARIRLTISAAWNQGDLARLLAVLTGCRDNLCRA